MQKPIIDYHLLGFIIITISYAHSQDDPRTLSSPTADLTVAVGAPTGVVSEICYPTKSNNGDPIPVFPCNQLAILQDTCGVVTDPLAAPARINLPTADLSRQQKCFCKRGGKGQYYFENLIGCLSCEYLHGDPIVKYDPATYVDQLSQAYCNQSPASLGFPEFSLSWTFSPTLGVTPLPMASDVLGTSAQVDLYFTTTPLEAHSSPVSVTIGTATISHKISPTGVNIFTATAIESSGKAGGKAGNTCASMSNIVQSSTTSIGSTTPLVAQSESGTAGAATTTKSGSSAARLQISGALCVVALGVACLL